jgi:aryl-alcohol dehydrogenase (NADP+)
MRRRVKVRAIGVSTFPVSEIVEAQRAAEPRRLSCFRGEQPPEPILDRGIGRNVLPTCQRHGATAS